MDYTIFIVTLMQLGGAIFTVSKGVFDISMGFAERRRTQSHQHRTEARTVEVQRTQVAIWHILWAAMEKGRLLQKQRHQQGTATQQLMLTMLLGISALLAYHHLIQHQPFIIYDQYILSILFLASSSCYVFYSSRWSQLASITFGAVLVVKPLLLQWLWLSKYASVIFLACGLAGGGIRIAGRILGVPEDQCKFALKLFWGATHPLCALLSSVQLFNLLSTLWYTGPPSSIAGQPEFWGALGAFSQAGYAMCVTLTLHTQVDVKDYVFQCLLLPAFWITWQQDVGADIEHCLRHMIMPAVYDVARDLWQVLGPMVGLLAKYHDAWLVLASVGQLVVSNGLHNSGLRRWYTVVSVLCMIAAGKRCMDVAGKELMWSVSLWWKLLALFGSFTWAVAILIYGESGPPDISVLIPGLLCHFLAAVLLLSSWVFPVRTIEEQQWQQLIGGHLPRD